ncbi:lymphotoxin-alpha-like isoform X1 [Polyodon spathula]|uniref:lymphotoxin-alpha-like isoform X1 n=1 Tax=Polyodon spathula TaxID=7913 RepID=UPI001B7E04F4|nr:lymphotoxin-alpha-like isoform X1 [Polyodon spathula]
MEKTVACDSSLALDIERSGLVVVRETSKKSDRCWKRIGLLSFMLLTAATLVLVMMYFGVIPSKIKQTNTVISTTPEVSMEVIENMRDSLKQIPDKKYGRKPSAHLIADFSKGHTKLSWLSNVNQAFLQNGMRLENEQELVIPADGLYFIYAQVVFKGMGSSSEDKGASNSWNGCSGCGSSTKILSLSVERLSDAYPMYESILSTSRSIYLQKNQGGVWIAPLYQGALFKLTQGDKLQVKASPLDLINDSKTFFGAFAV